MGNWYWELQVNYWQVFPRVKPAGTRLGPGVVSSHTSVSFVADLHIHYRKCILLSVSWVVCICMPLEHL